jgi:hypothetical protein
MAAVGCSHEFIPEYTASHPKRFSDKFRVALWPETHTYLGHSEDRTIGCNTVKGKDVYPLLVCVVGYFAGSGPVMVVTAKDF